MLRPIDLIDDTLVVRQQKKKIHALAPKAGAMAQKLHSGGIVVEIDLRDEGREPVCELRSVEPELGVEQIAFSIGCERGPQRVRAASSASTPGLS
ncbi:hypothetical protein [Sinorhizobium meliloti]|uniref:hypothetical protein n=1 Tax=Rhizobium meliloti TaxID=382 RepID=UPI00035F88EF|nr:hypothetical protein [Sinorhizobium meliloti]